MKNKLWLLLFIPFLYAGTFVFHTNGTITGRAKSCGAVCSSRPDALRIDLATYNSITKYHKVENDQVVEMTQQEKDTLDQTEADAQEASEIASVNELQVTIKEAFLAWLTVYNSKVPAQYQVTPQELKNQVLIDKGLTP